MCNWACPIAKIRIQEKWYTGCPVGKDPVDRNLVETNKGEKKMCEEKIMNFH